MSGMWGQALRLSIFGESHGEAIGMVVDGLPPGMPVDGEEIARDMARRAPGRDKTSTPRKEADAVRIVSGVHDGRTTGAPICGMIENTNTRSADYGEMTTLARPGHADYSGFVRYQGHNDVRGGGHFSGRLTAPLVFAGALARQFLQEKGVTAGAHIARIGAVDDECFDPMQVSQEELVALRASDFPLLRPVQETAMREQVESARVAQDSIGGIVECAAVGLSPGWGHPFFDSVESLVAHLLFSVPAVKGVEFGDGFALSQQRGSEANDSFYMDGERVKTRTNHNGGLNGGITNGMPLVLRAAIKPTSSISQEQQTIDYREKKDAVLRVRGRHDPCIVLRAVPVVEAALMLGLTEVILATNRA